MNIVRFAESIFLPPISTVILTDRAYSVEKVIPITHLRGVKAESCHNGWRKGSEIRAMCDGLYEKPIPWRRGRCPHRPVRENPKSAHDLASLPPLGEGVAVGDG